MFFSSAMNSDTDAPKRCRVTAFAGCAAGWGGTSCCSHRSALYHHGQQRLSAEPFGGVRHAIPAVECSRIAHLGQTRRRRAARSVLRTDYTLMVSPARALGRYANQRHSDPTAESHSAGRHFGAAMASPFDGPLGPTGKSGSGLMSLTPPWPHKLSCAGGWLGRRRSARCPRQIDVSRKTGVLASLAELELELGRGRRAAAREAGGARGQSIGCPKALNQRRWIRREKLWRRG